MFPDIEEEDREYGAMAAVLEPKATALFAVLRHEKGFTQRPSKRRSLPCERSSSTAPLSWAMK
jgi:hypothetical protein